MRVTPASCSTRQPSRCSATFDFEQNDGEFDIETSHDGFTTKWELSGREAIQLHGEIKLPRYATEFDEIDDPSAFHSTFGWVRLEVGDIGILTGGLGYLLIKVVDVQSGRAYGATKTSVSIEWRARPRPADGPQRY